MPIDTHLLSRVNALVEHCLLSSRGGSHRARILTPNQMRYAFALALTAACQPAHARPTTAEDSTGRALDIVVTARRFDEPVMKVPMSVSAIAGEDIEATGANTLADLGRSIPNLVVAPNGVLGTEQPAIRGIFSPAGSSTVGIYLGETPVQIRSTGFSRNPDLRTFDLEQVEILRGPQGTLFGANSMGGTIRFIPRQPSLDEMNGYSRFEIASLEGGDLTRAAELAIGAPIFVDRLAVRMGAYYRHDAGYVDRIDRNSGEVLQKDVDGLSALARRFALRARPVEDVEISPSVFYQRSRRKDSPFFSSDLGQYRLGARVRQPANDGFVLPSLAVNANLGAALLTSASSFLDRNDQQVTDYSRSFGELVLGGAVPGVLPEDGTRSHTTIGQRGWTQEIRLSSSSEDTNVKWVVGAFAAQSSLRLEQIVVEPGIEALALEHLGLPVAQVFGMPLLPGGVSYHGVEQVNEKQFAVFGDVTAQLLDGLEANLGLRVSRSLLGLRVTSEGPYAGGSIGSAVTQTQRETPVTPKVGLSYQAGAGLLYYVSASKGFRVGGANPPVPSDVCASDLANLGHGEAPASFNSDSLWSYEAGVKASLAKRRLQLKLSAFRITWSGIQQPIMLPNCGFSFVDNLGSARSQGFELESEARIFNNLTLNAALGFVDARFTKTIEGARSGTGSQPNIVTARGDRIPYVPRWTTRVAIEYRRTLAGQLGVFARSEYQYASSYRRAPSRSSASYNPFVYHGASYANVRLRAGVGGGRWQISAFAENLLDDRSILFSNADLVPATGTPLRQMTQRPRTVGIASSISF